MAVAVDVWDTIAQEAADESRLWGEALKAAGAHGWLDERQAALEALTAIKRAGADLVVSYWTKELAGWL